MLTKLIDNASVRSLQITGAMLVVLVAALTAFLLYPEQPQLTGNQGYQGQAAGYRAGGPDCQPTTPRASTNWEGARRAYACREAEEQHRLAANDLIQQRRAADAANAGAVLAYQQTAIAAVGAALGLITMMAAIAAAVFAKRAADETRRSADEAARAAAVATDTHQAFLTAERAILRIINADFRANDGLTAAEWVLALDVVNHGRSSATVSQVGWTLGGGPMYPKVDTQLTRYHPSEFVPVAGTTALSPLPMYDLPLPFPIYVMGYVEYVTLGALKFRTHFCYQVDPISHDGMFFTTRSHDTVQHTAADMPEDT